MFWTIILPIIRSTRLCYSLWYNTPTMLPATGWQRRGCIIPQAVAQSSVPEDGQNNFPKHFELTGIIIKPLLLHLVSCLYYLYQWYTVKQISDNKIYLLIKYTKSVLWRVAKRLSYIEDARCLKVKRIIKCAERNTSCSFEVFSHYLSGKRRKRPSPINVLSVTSTECSV